MLGRVLFYLQSDFVQAVDDAFDDFFKFYVVSDQHSAAGRKIGFEV